jgi:hypothetical protein
VCQGLIIAALRSHPDATLIMTSLDKWPRRRMVLCLWKHNTYKRQTAMPYAEFKPATPASERPQTHALDHAATGMAPFTLPLRTSLLNCIL